MKGEKVRESFWIQKKIYILISNVFSEKNDVSNLKIVS